LLITYTLLKSLCHEIVPCLKVRDDDRGIAKKFKKGYEYGTNRERRRGDKRRKLQQKMKKKNPSTLHDFHLSAFL